MILASMAWALFTHLVSARPERSTSAAQVGALLCVYGGLYWLAFLWRQGSPSRRERVLRTGAALAAGILIVLVSVWFFWLR
jgi:hypothetical protein